MIHMLHDRLVFLWRYVKNFKLIYCFVCEFTRCGHMWSSEDNLESWFSSRHVDLWIKLGSLGVVASWAASQPRLKEFVLFFFSASQFGMLY